MLKLNDRAPFDLLSWLEGKTAAEGVFEDRLGRPKRRFTVEMIGAASGETFQLSEHFIFADGERQKRVWSFRRGSGHGFTGSADDSVGDATGQFGDGVAYLSSQLILPVGKRRIAMTFDDAFYRLGAGLVLNRSRVSKWGLSLGQVIMLLRKDDQRSP